MCKRVTDISAVIVAVCALWISISEMNANTLNRKLSVQPALMVSSMKNEEGYSLTLRNSGLGPARIKWMKVFIGKKEIGDWDGMYEQLKIRKGKYRFTTIYPEQLIAAEAKKKVLFLEPAAGVADQLLAHV